MPEVSTSRRRELTAAAALLVATAGPLLDARLGGDVMDTPLPLLAAAAAGFLAGAWLRPVAAALGCSAGAALLTAANQVTDVGDYSVPNDLFFFGVVLCGTGLVGALVDIRRRQTRALRRLSQVRADQRAARVRAVRLEERNRVDAAVIHGVAQRMSALAVQASGARCEPEPGARQAAFASIEQAGRDVLDDLRSVLGSLRAPDLDEPSAAEEPGSSARRPGRVRIGWTDLLAGCAGVPVAFEAVASTTAAGPAWANVLLGLALGVPLVWRRRWPLGTSVPVFVLAMAMSAFLTPLTLTVSVLAPLSLMAYAVGDYARGWRRGAGLCLLGLGLAGVLVATPAASRGSDGLVPTAIWVCLAVVAGAVAALHRDRAEQLQEVLRRIEADQQVELRVAVAEQREAIARDLHDSVAHAMTVVCLHAGAAQRLPGDEQVIRGSVDIIDTCVRGVLTELREGLDVLEPAGSVSAADLSHEVGLIAQEMGLRLTVDVTGADFEVDEQTAGIARRVAREALVNVARHAPSSPAQVRISLSPAELEIEAVNALDHSGSSGGYALGSGSGLAGLDRLLQEHDGRLEYGETGAQQFRVAAYLPIATRVPA